YFDLDTWRRQLAEPTLHRPAGRTALESGGMASDFSFDVVSEFDRQELVNAIDQASREIHTRYDLKDSGSSIALEGETIKLVAGSEMALEAVRDLLLQRAVK